MEIDKKTFSKIPIFSGLPPEQIDKILEITTLKEYPENSTVIREGETGDEIFILLDGEVEVSKSLVMKISNSELEQKEKSLTRLTSENFPIFGEMILFDEEEKRTATVVTTRNSKFAVISKDNLINLAEKDREIGYILFKNIACVLAKRLKKANSDILKLTTAISLILQK